jgi:glucokinase
VARGPFIVVSGIPASGTSTLARGLGAMLGYRVIDKDDLLEASFPASDAVSEGLRYDLSRKADTLMRKRVELLDRAVLVSSWRRPELSTTSGTPTGWLADLPGVVEVYCSCRPETAARRFVERTRHPGHGDDAVDPTEMLAQFRSLHELGPLGVGRLVRVETEQPPHLAGVLRRITGQADGPPTPGP